MYLPANEFKRRLDCRKTSYAGNERAELIALHEHAAERD
jgi:hypothetical protein